MARRRRITAEPHIPLHQRVRETLEHDILTGKYRAGQKFPSEAALVRQFETSRLTIGRAVKELERRGLVERIAGSGTYVRARGYGRPTFGLLIPELGRTEIFDPICRGIAGAPDASRYSLLWGNGSDALQSCEQFIGQEMTGVFFAPLEEVGDAGAVNLEVADKLERARIAVVLLDRDFAPFPFRSRFDLVGIDNRRAGYIATDHLIRPGASRVAFLGHARAAPTVDARMAGYAEAVRAHGMSELIARPEALTHDDLWSAHRKVRADAYVCANDRTAGELMHALLRRGIRIPEDVRIAGIDDVEYASLLPVPLTTVHQPCREIGQTALSVMVERVAQPGMPPREVLLESRLVVRASCGSRANLKNEPAG